MLKAPPASSKGKTSTLPSLHASQLRLLLETPGVWEEVDTQAPPARPDLVGPDISQWRCQSQPSGILPRSQGEDC